MSSSQPTPPTTADEHSPGPKKQPGVVFLLLAGHVVTLTLCFYGMGGPSDWRDNGLHEFCQLLWLGLVCGTVSLAAIFGVTAPLPALVRLPVAHIAAAVAWGLVMAGQRRPIDASITGGWASLVVVQFVLVTTGAALVRMLLQRASGKSISQLIGRYSLAMLLAWTTLIAVALGIMRYAFAAFQWDAKVLMWEWYFHLIVLGIFNAAVGLVALGAVLGSWRRSSRWMAALVVSFLLLTLEPYLLAAMFGRIGANFGDVWILGGVQIVSLFVTLGIVRWAGGLAEQAPPLRSLTKT